VDISDFSVEDFVLDGSFRMWVLCPSKMSNIQWDRLLRENPSQFYKAKRARQIVLNLSTKQFRLSDSENSDLWGAIESELDDLDSEPSECKMVPISPESVLKKLELQRKPFLWFPQGLRVAGVMVIAFALSLSTNLNHRDEPRKVSPEKLGTR